MAEPARAPVQRRADVEVILATTDDAWVATSGERLHLVPLTFLWNEPEIVFATPDSALTTRNLRTDPRARLAFGGLRDVVLADVTLDRVTAITAAPALLERYVDRHGMDPSTWGEDYVFIVVRAQRIQAWREANELDGRTLMRDGRWLA